jgi:hypothetical protein
MVNTPLPAILVIVTVFAFMFGLGEIWDRVINWFHFEQD